MNCLYTERQKFNQWWLWALLVCLFIHSTISCLKSGVNFYFIITITICLFFYILELRISVDTNRIYYQFFPIHVQMHYIEIKQIKKIEAIKYSPLYDYGGWGIKYSLNGRAYTVRGNKGVSINLVNGKNILLGTQEHKKLETILHNLLKSL